MYVFGQMHPRQTNESSLNVSHATIVEHNVEDICYPSCKWTLNIYIQQNCDFQCGSHKSTTTKSNTSLLQ